MSNSKTGIDTVIRIQKESVEDIVNIVAIELEISELGLEEREVLRKLVTLVIALYLYKLNPSNSTGDVH